MLTPVEGPQVVFSRRLMGLGESPLCEGGSARIRRGDLGVGSDLLAASVAECDNVPYLKRFEECMHFEPLAMSRYRSTRYRGRFSLKLIRYLGAGVVRTGRGVFEAKYLCYVVVLESFVWLYFYIDCWGYLS